MNGAEYLSLLVSFFALGGWLYSLSRRIDTHFSEPLRLRERLAELNDDQLDSLCETEETGQAACGFAWDLGREIARLEECLKQCGLQAFMRNRSPAEVAGHMKYIADSWFKEQGELKAEIETLRRQLDEARKVNNED